MGRSKESKATGQRVYRGTGNRVAEILAAATTGSIVAGGVPINAKGSLLGNAKEIVWPSRDDDNDTPASSGGGGATSGGTEGGGSVSEFVLSGEGLTWIAVALIAGTIVYFTANSLSNDERGSGAVAA